MVIFQLKTSQLSVFEVGSESELRTNYDCHCYPNLSSHNQEHTLTKPGSKSSSSGLGQTRQPECLPNSSRGRLQRTEPLVKKMDLRRKENTSSFFLPLIVI